MRSRLTSLSLSLCNFPFLSQIMGLWYGSEIIIHSQDYPGVYEYDSCVIIHLTDVTQLVSLSHSLCFSLSLSRFHMPYVLRYSIANAMGTTTRRTSMAIAIPASNIRITIDVARPRPPMWTVMIIYVGSSRERNRISSVYVICVWCGVSEITIWSTRSTTPQMLLACGPMWVISVARWPGWINIHNSRAACRWWRQWMIIWCSRSVATMSRVPSIRWCWRAIDWDWAQM